MTVNDNDPYKAGVRGFSGKFQRGEQIARRSFKLSLLAAHQFCFGFFQEVVLVGFQLTVNGEAKLWLVINEGDAQEHVFVRPAINVYCVRSLELRTGFRPGFMLRLSRKERREASLRRPVFDPGLIRLLTENRNGRRY